MFGGGAGSSASLCGDAILRLFGCHLGWFVESEELELIGLALRVEPIWFDKPVWLAQMSKCTTNA